MRTTSLAILFLLCFGVAAYAVGLYGFGKPGVGLPPEMRAAFEAHAGGIRLHIFASALALLLGPLQFSSRLRARKPHLHRWLGRIYLGVAVLLGGLAGLYMANFASGGMAAKLGFAGLASAWLYTGARAYAAAARARDFAAHRRWMIRNFALSCAAVTLRIYLPPSLIAGIPFEQAYPVIAWACWLPNLLVAEWIIRASGRTPYTSSDRPGPSLP